MAQTIFITGGAKRIGFYIAQTFAGKGFNVALHYNKSEKEAQDLASRFPSSIKLYQSDLRNTHDTVNALKQAMIDFQGVDILINNASIFEESLISNVTESQFDDDFVVHVRTPIFLIKAIAEHKKDACIINMVDVNTKRECTKYFSYLLSKKMLIEATKLAASEFKHIRINAISPGFILPQVSDDENLEEIYKIYKSNLDDIVSTVEFFITNKSITGTNIIVSGSE